MTVILSEVRSKDEQRIFFDDDPEAATTTISTDLDNTGGSITATVYLLVCNIIAQCSYTLPSVFSLLFGPLSSHSPSILYSTSLTLSLPLSLPPPPPPPPPPLSPPTLSFSLPLSCPLSSLSPSPPLSSNLKKLSFSPLPPSLSSLPEWYYRLLLTSDASGRGAAK